MRLKIRGKLHKKPVFDKMAYYRSRSPQEVPETRPDNSPSDLLDVGRSGLAGFMQGLSGKNMTFEQWLRERKRRKQGFPTPSSNWLQRLITPK